MPVKPIKIFFICLLFPLSIFSQNINKLNLYLFNSEYKNAAYFGENLIKEFPDNTKILYKIAIAYQMLNKNKKAQTFIKNACLLDTTNTNYINFYANILNINGYQDKAIKFYGKTLNFDSLNFYALNNLSKLYFSQKKFLKALHFYTILSSEDSLNSFYYRKSGLCYLKLKDIKTSLNCYLKAYFIDTISIINIKSLAFVYLKTGTPDSAIKYCDKGIKIDSTYSDFYKIKADAHFVKNHFYRAVPEYKKVLQLGDTSYNILKRLGMALCEIKKYKEALPYNLAVYKSDSTSYSNTTYLCRNYLGLRNYDKSLEFAEKTLKLIHFAERISYDIYDNMAHAYIGKEQLKKALNMFLKKESVFKSYPHYFNLNNTYETALIYDKLKDKKNALKYYKKILNYYENKQIKDFDTPIYKYANQRVTKLTEDLFFEGK